MSEIEPDYAGIKPHNFYLLAKMDKKWEVYDCLRSCRIGLYQRKSNATRRQNKEIQDRNLPRELTNIIVRRA